MPGSMTHPVRQAGVLALAFAAALLSSTSHADAPRIVASIKPVELLVRAVAPDNLAVTSLVPAGASPHTYQLRPSERRTLQQADQVFWIGPGMETFLQRLLTGAELADRTHALNPEVTPSGEGKEHGQNHTEGHHGHDGHDHGHGHGEGEDAHVWLDPALALAMARDIAGVLKTLPGVSHSETDQRLRTFEQRLAQTESDIRKQLAAATDVSLFTYHDAFSRFAGHYGLTIAGVLTTNPQRSPGARHVAEVQAQLAATDNPCLLTEPQFSRDWWTAITDGVELRRGSWDPLASDIEADRNGYLRHQQSLADAVLACLPE